MIKPVKGRKKIKKRKTKRGPGKIKKKVKNRKQNYVKIIRKLRKYLMGLRDKGKIDRELYRTLRKKIKIREFKSKSNLKEYLEGLDIKDKSRIKESKKIRRGINNEKTNKSS